MGPSIDSHVRLADGRKLGYAEHGDPGGTPLLFFPGTPHSRLSGPNDEGWLRQRRIRFVTVERPGFGISDWQPARRLVDWPADVDRLADALSLPRFFVVGTSGGGPYVAACARFLSHRIDGAAIVAGFGPLDGPEATKGMAPTRRVAAALFRHAPRLVQALANPLPLHRHPAAVYGYMARAMAPDRDVLGAGWDARLRDVTEALRPGLRGFTRELSLVSGDWGFRLEDIRATVHVWHGTKDQATPFEMGQDMANRIPGCLRHFVPGAGHLLWKTHQPEILESLLGGLAAANS